MKLKELFSYYGPLDVEGMHDSNITGFSVNSKKVDKGNIFFAFKGSEVNGACFADEAFRRGAAAVVIDDSQPVKIEKTFKKALCRIKVKDQNLALSRWSAAYYGFPSKKMDITGVTGTNGKTTVSFLIYEILKKSGKAGIIGTPGYEFDGKKGDFDMTTPMAHELQKVFADMLRAGVEKVVMEVSSHGLKLKRVEDVEFSAAVFTNLTRDHLDFHKRFKDYFYSKMHLFELLRKKTALINADDRYGKKLMKLLDFKPSSYGINDKKAKYRACIDKMSLLGSDFVFYDDKGNKVRVNLNLVGKFNVYNCLAALGWGMEKGGDMETLCKIIEEAPAVPGRLEIHGKSNMDEKFFVIDYAHTPDALENVLRTLRPMTSGRLICVFGCGGNRDRNKRPIMGRIAGDLADVAFITSDNPRYEDPLSIILDIEVGIRRTDTDYYVIPERRECIQEAMKFSSEGDCVLIAGKGDEEYQIINDKKIPFSDREVASEYI